MTDINQQLSETEQQLRASELELRKNIARLTERSKEFKALYSISLIVDKYPDSPEKMLRKIVAELPGSLQYPAEACARIGLAGGEKYKTDNFRKTAHMLRVPIKDRKREYGEIEIGYLRLEKSAVKSPFLREEKKLLTDISERIGKALSRREAAEELHGAYQQLMASNQQMRATEQQLRASNQQLRATEQQLRASNRALAESEEKYRSIVELQPDMIIRLDGEGNYLEIIKYFAGHSAAPDHELTGKNISDMFSKEETEKIKKAIEKSLDEETLETVEYSLDAPKRNLFFEARIIPVDKNEIITLIRNITERKLNEEGIKRVALLNRSIFDISSSFITARPGTITDKIQSMLKKSGEVFNAGRTYLFRFSPGGKEMSKAHEWCAEGVEPLRSFFGNIDFERPSWCNKKIREDDFLHIPDVDSLPPEAAAEKKILKKQKVKSLLCVPVRDKNNNITGIIGFDAVRSKKSWDEREIYPIRVLANIVADAFESIETEKHMIQTQKLESIGRLAGGVAHEINNPLGSILAAAQLALEETGSGGPLHGDLRIIEESAKRCAVIVKRLLEFSRKGTGETEKINLNKVIKYVLSMINKQIEFKNIRLIKRFEEHLPPVEANIQNMEQVFLNLLINARDAMPSGGKITIKTQKHTHNGNSYVTATVIDTGQGIDENILEKLFEPFFTTKKSGVGTGLGLAIVKSILNGIGAEIEVESSPGRGSEFKITIPAAVK